MATMTTYSWGTVLRTREEDRVALIKRAAAIFIDSVEEDAWDDVPTWEAMSRRTKPSWARTH